MTKLHRAGLGLLVGLSPLALIAGQAVAQDTAPAAQPAAPGEIIVTAQRRSERLVDVPISITALSGETLARTGITSTLELAQVTPGLQLPLNGAYTQPSIRGVSSSGSGLADSSNVAIYVDGVYQPSQTGQAMELPNIEDVEVLKGPQGTLYGQNAAGGAIIINTITPSFTTKGSLTARYGNYGDKAAQGYVTGPVTDNLAFALAGAYENRNGFNIDLLHGGHDRGLRTHQVRGKLLWNVGGGASFTFAGFYSVRNDSTAYASQPYDNISIGTPYVGLYGLPTPTKPHEFTQSVEPDILVRSYGASVQGKIPLGDVGTLSTVTAYGNVRAADWQDSDLTGVNLAALGPFIVKQHDFIQELNFLSRKMGGLTLSAGLFYMYNTERYDPYVFNFYDGTAYPTVPTTTAVFGNYTQNKRDDYAAYIEANYDITDKLTVTAGGRYSYEQQKILGSGYPDPNMISDPRGTFHFDKFTPRAVIRFKPDANNSFYASFTQGFKNGFVDANPLNSCYDPTTHKAYQCLPLTDAVKPEVLTSYEVGYKGKLFDALTLSVAAFHYDYKDIQIYVYEPTAGGGRYMNAAKARINGAEFDATYRASHDLTLRVGGVYLDAKYKNFESAEAFVPYSSVPGGCPAASSPGGNCAVSVDASGNRMMRAPKFTLTANVDYEHEMDWGSFGLSANLNYDSGFYFDPVENLRQKRYTLVNAQVFVQPKILHGLRLSVYGKNLTNKNYLSSTLESTVTTGMSYGAPRQYGVQADFKF